MMQHIGRSIDALFRSGRLAEGAAGWRAVEAWPEVVGEEISRRTRAIRFEHGVLYVAVASSSWIQELSFLKRRVKTELNAALGRPVIKDLRFSLEGGGRTRHRSEQ